jgi:hypothetical protein
VQKLRAIKKNGVLDAKWAAEFSNWREMLSRLCKARLAVTKAEADNVYKQESSRLSAEGFCPAATFFVSASSLS